MTDTPIASPESVVCAALETVPALAGKVYPLEILRSSAPPFAFYAVRTDEAEEALDGDTDLRSMTMDIHFVSGTFAGVLQLAHDACAALHALSGTETDHVLFSRVHLRQSSPDLREAEVSLYRRVYDAEIDYQITQ